MVKAGDDVYFCTTLTKSGARPKLYIGQVVLVIPRPLGYEDKRPLVKIRKYRHNDGGPGTTFSGYFPHKQDARLNRHSPAWRFYIEKDEFV